MPERKNIINAEIDWDALDRSWADRYEDDYGVHFFNISGNHGSINLQVSSIIRLTA